MRPLFLCLLCQMLIGCNHSPKVAIPVIEVQDPVRDAELYAKECGAQYYYGFGSSMQPQLPDHSSLIVEPIPFHSLRIGMVIVFCKNNGMRVAHQIVNYGRNGYVTQGTHNAVADAELVTADKYIGVITRAYVQNKKL